MKRQKKKGAVLRAAAILVACAMAAFVIAGLISLTWNNRVFTVKYEVSSDKLSEGFRVLLISDLHLREFGKNNSLLVARAKETKPDIICLGGDMIESYASWEQEEAFVDLVRRLLEIAPVYIGTGNHDALAYYRWTTHGPGAEILAFGDSSELNEKLTAVGAVMLEKSYADIEINGQRVRIGGFYPFAYKTELESESSWAPRRAFLEDYCDTDSFKLMISHRPEGFISEDGPAEWDVDLVLSGHTHNGVVALPLLGAIWTNEGIFPKHDRGLFHEECFDMVICGGLDGHGNIPRVFNPPEIVVIDVKPQ